jgi:Phospholipase_D-nuclease N-terminal
LPDIVAGIVSIGFVVLWIYCIYDVITTDDAIIRHLPKALWLIIVVLLPDLGSLLWLALGRPRVWTRRAHDPQRYGTSQRGRLPTSALGEEASYPNQNSIVRYREEQSRLRMREEQLNRREAELRRRELGEDPTP